VSEILVSRFSENVSMTQDSSSQATESSQPQAPVLSSLSHLKGETGVLLFLVLCLLLTGLLGQRLDSALFTLLFVSLAVLVSTILLHLYLQLNKPLSQSLLAVNQWSANILDGNLQARMPSLPFGNETPIEHALRKNINR